MSLRASGGWITVFSARLYGSRSHKNKKLIDDMKEAVEDAKDA